jgi:hypothetical protein
MITINNYFEKIRSIDLANNSPALRQARDFVWKVTNEGKDWDAYHASDKIRKTVDLYLDQLNNLSTNVAKKGRGRKPQLAIKKKADNKITSIPSDIHTTIKQTNSNNVVMVSRIPDEIRFIRRFVNLDGKTQTKEQVLRFINSLQKAIIEKRIRKTSQWAEHIVYIQNKLIEVCNGTKDKVSFSLKQETHNLLKDFVAREKVLSSVGFIKRYIGLHAKADIKDKAKALLTHIDKAFDKDVIGSSDPYITEIYKIQNNLRSFIADKSTRKLNIEEATLNGLQGIIAGLEGCGCQSLNGVEQLPEVMNSMDFANMEFNSIGLDGKWGEFIGDPSPGFTAMVYGKPKNGKSFLCLDFAGHLAREHGAVLFVAKEEGFSRTLRDKLVAVKHPRLTVAATLPANLTSYEYVFLDSVTRLGLTPDDLRMLKSANPRISFIYVFQVIKNGQFRGNNDFQHDVDIVIEVPEKGRAVQYGRYNQGGEMDIFS